LLQAGWTAETQLRVAITGGEALTRDLAVELLPRTASLWNYYGPTETTIWSSFKQVAVPDDAVLIGRPLANTELYVLDRARQPVPMGVPGELYIGGHGLARGYLNRPELTAERFIPHPFTADPEARVYKTGDLVRFQHNGEIEYIGRLDHQIKLRGFRIELGEIESVLRQHPALEAALVILREDVPGDPKLVAYLVPKDTLPTVDVLRQWTQQHLPLYMVPAAFVSLDALPLTPNGKLDRNALPAPDNSRALIESAYVAPQTATEATIAAIWAELLGLSRIGIHDNFFTLGGHSLLATQLMARITATCGVELPLRSLFEQPTVAALAASVDHEQSSTAGDDLDAITGLVDMLDSLSEAEVEALLEQKLMSIRGEA
jgi:acyl carrier protein